MTDKKLLLEYPGKRIKPVDGLAVTAQVWEESHEYHRQRLRYHELLLHGIGIVDGLDVISSDPPDSTVYVLPGIAVDPQGQVILVREPVAYDVGPASGTLFLVLTYGESRPTQEMQTGPAYVHTEFSLEVSSQAEGHGGIVLAQLRRERGAAICSAQNAEFPGPNEIDLRFRPCLVGGQSRRPQPASLGVFYPGGAGSFSGCHGAAWLARSLRQAGNLAWVDDNIQLGSGLERYDLLYLPAAGGFQLSREQLNALYAYLGGGGTVLMESCLKDAGQEDSTAAASFSDVLASFGQELEEVGRGHPLLIEPHLFSLPPAGYEEAETPPLRAGGGVILSLVDYGCLWQGERRSRPATREEIRTALEWGENILRYAQNRRKEAQAG
jgi:hypothetical protein